MAETAFRIEQRMKKTRTFLKENIDLTLTIICGLLIALGFIFETNDQLIVANVTFSLAIVIGGFESAKEGIDTFKDEHKFDANFLMILAAIGACIIGHFSEGAILIFIFSLSHSLEHYTESKSRDAISELMKMVPETARKYQKDGSIIEVETKDLKVGDRIQVPKGEMVPIDGELIGQEAYLNEASITGESMPVYKAENDLIIGGTLNVGDSFDILVSVENADTLMAKIVTMVDQAQNNLSDRESLIGKIEGVFVKIVLIFVPLFILLTPWLLKWDFQTAFYRGMVMLTVASPCALVASASPAKLSAISRAARQGMILRGGNVLDLSADIDTVVFDKTGTLTLGLPSVTNAYYVVTEEEELINRIVKSAEATSTHPIANAFMRQFQNVELLEPDKIENITGHGFKLIHKGQVWKIGNRKLILDPSHGDEFTKLEEKYITAFEEAGSTIVFVTCNDQLMAFFGITDPVKEDSAATVAALHEQGIETYMLTGDAEKNSFYIAKQIGIDQVRPNLLPGDKLEIIKDLQAAGKKVLMVGDGVNDAPALAIADVGMAMGSGTDVAMETADIILVKNDLNRLPYMLAMAKQTSRIIKQNIFLSLSVILLLIVVNVLQVINLPLGVVAHEGSTIIVILNGLRMLTFGKSFAREDAEHETSQMAEMVEMIKVDDISERKREISHLCCEGCTGDCLVQYGYSAEIYCKNCRNNPDK